MDPVTVGAVLAIVSGAAEEAGSRLWDGVVALVRRPFRKAAVEMAGAPAVSAGEAELAALQQAPGDQQRAMALAEVLLARADTDAGFGQALRAWWQQAEPVRASLGDVTNTISGGTQHGPVLQGRDFSNITIGAPSESHPGPSSEAKETAEEAEAAGSYYDDGYGGRTEQTARASGKSAIQQIGADGLLVQAHMFYRSAQEVVYHDLVRGAFADSVKPGRLLFNPPNQMKLRQRARVEVRLTGTPELDAELLEHLRGPGEPQIEEVPTAPFMAVTLKGEGFQITAYSDEEQSVTPDGITTWEYDILALKRGSQRLVMSVSLRIPALAGYMGNRSIPVREAVIDVEVGAPVLVALFVSDNWQWFIGTGIAIAAVLVAVLLH